MTGRWFNGREPSALGWIVRSVPRAQLTATTEDLVGHFRSTSRTCLAEVKAVMRSGVELNLKAAVRLETKHFMAYLKRSQDANEGFRAYRERRVPRWES